MPSVNTGTGKRNRFSDERLDKIKTVWVYEDSQSQSKRGHINLVDKDVFESMVSKNAREVRKFSYYLASAKDSLISQEIEQKCKDATFGYLSPQNVSAGSYSSVFSGADLQAIEAASAETGTLFVGYNSRARRPTLLLMAILMMKCETTVCEALGWVANACAPEQLTDDFTFSSYVDFESIFKFLTPEAKKRDSAVDPVHYKCLFDVDDSGARLKVTEDLRDMVERLHMHSTTDYFRDKILNCHPELQRKF